MAKPLRRATDDDLMPVPDHLGIALDLSRWWIDATAAPMPG